MASTQNEPTQAVAALLWKLGMVDHLGGFMPNNSDATTLLNDLQRREATCTWTKTRADFFQSKLN